MTPQAETLFVFLDESGTLDFSGKGTDHFCLSALYTTTPAVSAGAVQALKYQLMAEGGGDFEFHATTNMQTTRDRVTATIRQIGSPNIRVHTLLCDKHFAHHTTSDLNGQIADYFSWAWFRQLESRDTRAVNDLTGVDWTRLNLFQNGHTRYW